jgi:hypothetical protein
MLSGLFIDQNPKNFKMAMNALVFLLSLAGFFAVAELLIRLIEKLFHTHFRSG